MRRTKDSDWTDGDTDVSETADTERPAALAFWRCDGEGFEPAAYPTLIEASGKKPATPDAIIAGNGELLAESASDICQWVFTASGMRRLETEMQGAIDRDSDTVLSLILADDFARAASS